MGFNASAVTPEKMSEKLYRNEDWLREKYVKQNLSQEEMAQIAECGQKTISRWLLKTGVKEKRKAPCGKDRENGICKTPATFGTYTFHDSEGAYEYWHGGKGNDMVSVHRLLAVSKYGFEAVKDKVVHHDNNISWDNRSENIEIMTASEHMKLHYNHKK